MNLEAIAAIAQVVAALAVVVTLFYLAIQIKHANIQAEVESHRHVWDLLNQWCDLISSSTETAEVVVKGRRSLDELDEAERLMFEHVHIRLLNTLESWYLQFAKTAKDKALKAKQMENLEGIAQSYFSYPGTRELWSGLRDHFPAIAHIVDAALNDA